MTGKSRVRDPLEATSAKLPKANSKCDLCLNFGTAGSLVGAVTLTPAQLGSLVDQLTYANVHTTNFPGGELRGQILP